MRLAFRRKLTNSLLMKSIKMEDWRNVCKLTKSLLMKSMKMEDLKKMWKLCCVCVGCMFTLFEELSMFSASWGTVYIVQL